MDFGGLLSFACGKNNDNVVCMDFGANFTMAPRLPSLGKLGDDGDKMDFGSNFTDAIPATPKKPLTTKYPTTCHQ